ncbi:MULTISPECIES: zinc-binding dehydrogenase [unclassified Streptomyces]|uniref:zinc-binding dehydrogenase n=1 Tax=unclassified Streptomyces TaxID=2593676 RepID=UPI00093F59AD|nr:zinc-binding dehydrogenase [Streptomyces sp. CB02058]OKI94308.1 alcohol dehydrogenase [Streptomyces sp. CB02058]
MRAAVVDALGSGFVVQDVDIAKPQGREVLVEVRASGLCHTDLTFATHAFAGFPPPVVLGHELAGVVVAVGPHTGSFSVGDHVVGCLVQWCGTCPACLDGRAYQCANQGATLRDPAKDGPRLSRAGLPVTQGMGLGAFAQQALVHENQLTAVPRRLPFAPAALLGCGVLTGAGSVLNGARVRAGETVAVIGAGGVGLNAVAAARLAGASRVVAVDVQDGTLRRARDFGATDVVNSAAVDAVAAVRELTGGGVRHAFDIVGVAATTEQALRMTARGGGVYIVGLAGGGGELKLSLPRLLLEQKSIQGVIMGSGNPRRDIPRYADLYLQGRLNLDGLVSRRIALDEIDAGYAAARDPEVARVVITSF